MRLSTPRTTLRPGCELGRYQIVRPLGIGGMAEVYLARVAGIEGFEKRVALKRLRPEYASNDEMQAMFLDEARMLARLSHVNVIGVHELAFDGETYLYTMEYVRGTDARGLMRRCWSQGAPVPDAHALRIVVDAAAGLHAAHEQAIVHRDVSPANLMVSREGWVKLIDFGVAMSPQRETISAPGIAKGKAAYMSPEQVLGRDVDRRSDIFSLGVVLYELTVGERAFAGDSQYEIFDAIARGQLAPPGDRVDGYPIELEAIVMRCLEPRPGRRYQTAQALQLDLEHYALHTGALLSSAELGHFVRTVTAGELAAAGPCEHRIARPIRLPTAIAACHAVPPATRARAPVAQVAAPARARTGRLSTS